MIKRGQGETALKTRQKDNGAYDESFNKYNQRKYNKFSASKLDSIIETAYNNLYTNNISKVISLLEKIIMFHEELYGQNSKEFYEFFNKLVMDFNSHALKLLNSEIIDLAFQILLTVQDFFKYNINKYPVRKE